MYEPKFCLVFFVLDVFVMFVFIMVVFAIFALFVFSREAEYIYDMYILCIWDSPRPQTLFFASPSKVLFTPLKNKTRYLKKKSW